MSFIESPRFLEKISLGASGGPAFSTEIAATRAGFESRNINWSQARARFDLSHVALTEARKDTLLAFFRMARGAGYGFRFKDWTDFRVAAAEGLLQPRLDGQETGTLGAGYGVATYQLFKRYGSGSYAADRRIRKPVSGKVALLRAGSPVTLGAGAGQAAVDTTTGVVTFVADQSQAISAHAVGVAHQITLGTAFSPNVAGGDRVWIEGVTGTAAALLNGRSHVVGSVFGAVINLTTNTQSLTASGGTARLYPQPSQALAWSGEFDVPVRFETDEARIAIAARGAAGPLYSWQTDLVEIRTE